MKRYLLFFGADYYSEGGMLDFVIDTDTVEEGIAKADKLAEKEPHGWSDYWAHIFDTETKENIWMSVKEEEIRWEKEQEIRKARGLK